ncbi:Polyphosphate kinase [compost metagenome]
MYFYSAGKEVTYISSADWMTRNLDHRIEAAVKINSKKIRDEIKDMLQIQLRDNVKARILNNELNNRYVVNDKEPCRSQIEIYKYLRRKTDEV